MSESRVTINSPISVIAKDIAEKYLWREFPTSKLPNGLLDYTNIRKRKINTTVLHRPIHGYQNACRIAALVRLIYEFYRKHYYEFTNEFQQIVHNDSTINDFVKKVQIVGLLRAVGRTKDSGSGGEFSHQGQKECLHYLESIGIKDEYERKYLASAIVDSENSNDDKKMSLASCLIKDATMIETLRDIVPYEKKPLPINAFAFFAKMEMNNQATLATLDEFIDLCCHHVKIIKSQQGFILCAIQDGKGKPIVEYWPDLDDYVTWKKNILKFQETQKKLEYTDDCFKTCEAEVDKGIQILYPVPLKLEDLFQTFISTHSLEKNSDQKLQIQFIENMVKYFHPKIGNLTAQTVGNHTYFFRLKWKHVKDYLINQYKIISEDTLKPNNLFHDALVTKNSDWYVCYFANQSVAEHYLRLIKLTLPTKFSFELRKADVIQETNQAASGLYRFRLTSEQFNNLIKLTNIDLTKVETIENFESLSKEFNNIVEKGSLADIKTYLTKWPALCHLPISTHGTIIKKVPILYCAINTNNLPLVKMLCEEHALNINMQTICKGEFDGMTPLFYAVSQYDAICGVKIVEYLLSRGADVNLICENGRTPLSSAVYYQREDKVKMLIATNKVDPNPVMDNGHTALINAVLKNNVNLVRLVLSIPGVNVNHKRNNGDTALLIAAKMGNISIINCLIIYPGIDLALRNSQGKTAYRIAVENGHKEIAVLLKQEMDIYFLEKDIPFDKRQAFATYADNLRKIPTRTLYLKYLQDIKNPTQSNTEISELESQYVKARKLWTDVVSETHASNANYVKFNDVKKTVIERLTALQFTCPELLYKECIEILKNNSVIVISFKSDFLKNNDLQDFELLNIWQKNNWSNKPSYTSSRDKAENDTFDYLSDELCKAILANKFARPRYGALFLLDNDSFISPVENYGESFLVLKDVSKLNVLVAPGDTLMYHDQSQKRVYKLCTIHHLEMVLMQLSDEKLKALADFALTGKLPSKFNQYNSSNFNKGYIEVLLPAINVLDPNMVESIYLNSDKFKALDSDLQIIMNRGINVFNSPHNPYKELNIQFIKAIKDDNAIDVRDLLRRYPSLRKIITDTMNPIELATQNGCLNVLKILPQCVTLKKFIKTVLYIACTTNNLDLLQDVLKQNIYPNLINSYNIAGNPPLHLALKNNATIELILLLLQHGANPNSKTIHVGGTSLHVAARFSTRPEVIQLFLHANANLSETLTSQGATPLHMAAYGNNPVALKILLTHGIDINIKAADGKTAFQSLNNKTNPEIIKIWLSYLIEKNEIENLKLLTSLVTVNINEQDENGDTLLHKKVGMKFPNTDFIKFLLENKADLNVLNNKGFSALHIATQKCLRPNQYSIEKNLIVDLLLQHNATIDEICIDLIRAELQQYTHYNKGLIAVFMKYVVRDQIDDMLNMLLIYNVRLPVSPSIANPSMLFAAAKDEPRTELQTDKKYTI